MDSGGTIGKIYGQEYNVTTYNLARMNMLLHGVKDTEFEIYHPASGQPERIELVVRDARIEAVRARTVSRIPRRDEHHAINDHSARPVDRATPSRDVVHGLEFSRGIDVSTTTPSSIYVYRVIIKLRPTGAFA